MWQQQQTEASHGNIRSQMVQATPLRTTRAHVAKAVHGSLAAISPGLEDQDWL